MKAPLRAHPEIPKHRLHNQRLVGAQFDTPEAVVGWLGAVQAQDVAGALWALGLRTNGTDAASVARAFDAGAFLRTHILRPTWHFVLPGDIRWMLRLTAPRVRTKLTYYDRLLDIDDAVRRRSHTLLAEALRDGRYQTRQELGAALRRGGIEASGQRLNHIVMHAELDGLVCSGPRRGKQLTYALLEERVPPAPTPAHDEALAMLCRRYFAGHGPATVHDFAWWSGLTVADARQGLSLVDAELDRITVEGETYWTTIPAGPIVMAEPVVHLLPNFDEHVVAYRDHGPSCHPAVAGTLQVRGGLDAHLIALNGLVVGGWRRVVQRHEVVVKTTQMVPLEESEQDALERAADGYGRFLGMPVVLEEAA